MNINHSRIVRYSESVLLQVGSMLKLLSQEQYVCKYPIPTTKTDHRNPVSESSIGSHVRHIHDHYEKLLNFDQAGVTNVINYDIRSRNTDVENLLIFCEVLIW